MKEKKTGQAIILIVFAVIVCFSRGIWFFAEKHLDSENYENREMTEMPRFTLDNYGAFSDDYNAYFNDHLQFRNNLISLNSGIDYFIFKKSSNSQVIVGDDNWLFYASSDDGDPIGDYLGINLYSEDELKKIAQNIETQQNFLLSQGKEFVLFIAPNKERVYSEYMPDKYGNPSEQCRALQIYEYLKSNTDVRVLYPYTELTDAKRKLNENIWYKTDTHWNYIGSYVGASSLLSELGIDFPSIYSDSITIIDDGETSGDLANMLNLGRQLKSVDREYTVEGFERHNAVCTESNIEGMIIYTAENADSRNIYVIRDSFSTQMAEYIGSQFSHSYLRHRRTYSYDDLLAHNLDIVVYETVERYVDELATFSVH